MSKLVIYLVVGAVILIYKWVAGAIKDGAAKNKQAPRGRADRATAVPDMKDWHNPWAELEKKLNYGVFGEGQTETEVAKPAEDRTKPAQKMSAPAKAAPKQASVSVSKAPQQPARPELPEEGICVTAHPDPDEAVKAERERNARLRAHYDRWRRAVVDTQVLERKF